MEKAPPLSIWHVPLSVSARPLCSYSGTHESPPSDNSRHHILISTPEGLEPEQRALVDSCEPKPNRVPRSVAHSRECSWGPAPAARPGKRVATQETPPALPFLPGAPPACSRDSCCPESDNRTVLSPPERSWDLATPFSERVKQCNLRQTQRSHALPVTATQTHRLLLPAPSPRESLTESGGSRTVSLLVAAVVVRQREEQQGGRTSYHTEG